MTLVLHRTDFPEALRDQREGLPGILGQYWFEHDGQVFGVSRQKWDDGITWEVFHGWTVASVRDDYDTLAQVRREAVGDCQGFLEHLKADNPFQVGDRALHKGGHLDSRPVAEVDGLRIRLEIGDVPDVWVDAWNYERIPQ